MEEREKLFIDFDFLGIEEHTRKSDGQTYYILYLLKNNSAVKLFLNSASMYTKCCDFNKYDKVRCLCEISFNDSRVVLKVTDIILRDDV